MILSCLSYNWILLYEWCVWLYDETYNNKAFVMVLLGGIGALQ